MGLVYNAITAGYILSGYGEIKKRIWKEIVENNIYDDFNLKSLDKRLKIHGIEKYSGKGLFSTILPKDLYYKKGEVLICDGVLIQGKVGKAHIGVTVGTIGHTIVKNYGESVCARFYTEAQKVFDYFLNSIGFTISMKDCLPADREATKKWLKSKINFVEEEIRDIKIEENNVYNKVKKEQTILRILSQFSSNLAESQITKDNSLYTMYKSGAKGSAPNLLQILGALGQQFLNSKRPDIQETERRCLPYHPHGTEDIRSRGFIDRGFNKGIDPDHFIFHLMTSRIGLIDTAIRTAETGSIHHKLSKVLEDIKNDYDGTVKTIQGRIINYFYHDGLNTKYTVNNTGNFGTIRSFVDMKSLFDRLNSENEY